jgi:hypothetical protein
VALKELCERVVVSFDDTAMILKGADPRQDVKSFESDQCPCLLGGG